ncbi:hypothetical protein BDZ90DRAFT_105447 [Jaminaea rosea]|uniref:Uncharacterized protein n=1 Tax=Jaminaea rosea TaxID=1569628 RepID=A0A316UVJ1_9BASI|nr:hypothetical protein BDZ90DRAFT_105447 [Jaminaea rosea]PWN29317.1 hypothetical protein BDZ90DRAFT_105447 [Jaminaea rosea]
MRHSPHDARGQRGSFSGAAASSSPSTRLAGMTRIPSSTHLPIKTELHPLSSLVNPSPARADQPGLTCPRPTHLALLSLLGLFTSYTLGYSHVAERRLIRHSLPHCSPRPSRRLRVVPLWRGREWMEGLVASLTIFALSIHTTSTSSWPAKLRPRAWDIAVRLPALPLASSSLAAVPILSAMQLQLIVNEAGRADATYADLCILARRCVRLEMVVRGEQVVQSGIETALERTISMRQLAAGGGYDAPALP